MFSAKKHFLMCMLLLIPQQGFAIEGKSIVIGLMAGE